MNLPNRLTVSRILATPLFLFFLVPGWFGQFFGLAEWGRVAAVVVFLLASITDLLDGHIARSRNLVTDLGKFMDPIADKLLVSAALIAMIRTDGLSVWFVFIIIAREFIVSGMRIVAVGQGVVVAADRLGKYKTLMQTIAVIALLLRNWPLSLVAPVPFGEICMVIAVILTVVSGFNYLWQNRGIFRTM